MLTGLLVVAIGRVAFIYFFYFFFFLSLSLSRYFPSARGWSSSCGDFSNNNKKRTGRKFISVDVRKKKQIKGGEENVDFYCFFLLLFLLLLSGWAKNLFSFCFGDFFLCAFERIKRNELNPELITSHAGGPLRGLV